MVKPKGKGKASASSMVLPIAPAELSTKPDNALPSIGSSKTALQETSGNRGLKRPRDTTPENDGDPYEWTPSPKRTPTPTCFTGNEYRAFRAKHPVRPLKEKKISGKYTLINGQSSKGHHMDTTGFEVKIFYDCRDATERKLYATFKFDKVEGIIRMRRTYGDIPGDDRRRLTPEEFDEICILNEKHWPARDNPDYRIRWRGKECGKHIIDGELQTNFEFHVREGTSKDGFPNMDIAFSLFYDDELFKFKAMKTADLDSADVERIGSLEQEWKDLHDSRPEARDHWEFEPMNDDDNWIPVRKRKYPYTNRRRKAEYHPFSNGSRKFGAPCLPPAELLSKKGGRLWDVSGRYWLQCTNRLEPVVTTEYCFELHYTAEGTYDLFATFEFGSLKGIMRLCPEEKLKARASKSLSGKEFDDACYLDEYQRPGPSNKNWLSRWRALDNGVLKGGETRAQGQFNMKCETDSFTKEKFMKISFVMMIDGKHLTFEGGQAAPLDPPGPDYDFRQEWEKLNNPDWEANPVPTLCQPGSIIEIKHKPKPVKATAAAKATAVVQEKPDWAWDITGHYSLRDKYDEFLESIKLPKTTKMIMSIYLANNPRHTKIGRQYWAEFRFGDKVKGCMRFCLPTENGHALSAKKFEESCVLNDDNWVGPPPNGITNLQYRWRAKDLDSGEKPKWQREDRQQGIDFKMGADGKLRLTAIFTVDWQPRVLEGVQIRDGEILRQIIRRSNAATVKSTWDLYKEKETRGGYEYYFDSD